MLQKGTKTAVTVLVSKIKHITTVAFLEALLVYDYIEYCNQQEKKV